jgi:DNA-binding beta-propeller fold protein YncE
MEVGQMTRVRVHRVVLRTLAMAFLCTALVGALGGCDGRPGGPGSAGQTGESSATVNGDSSAASGLSREEVQRRLALPQFAYVAETELKAQGKTRTQAGSLAVVDSVADKVASRVPLGKSLSDVAVTPDGRHIYITDSSEPVIHMLDAETNQEIRTIALPGVQPGPTDRDAKTKYTYEQMEGCSSAIRCTPDGKNVLVLSKAGLQVIDTASGTVTRTLPDLRGGESLAVSFDGKRAYVGTSDWLTRGAKPILGWADLAEKGEGGVLALVDLETWQVAKKRTIGLCGGIAVRPDDTQVFYSDIKERTMHVVDPSTLADVAVVQLKGDKASEFTPNGVGVLPDGSKAYVVCAWVNSFGAASADNFFCAVVETASWKVAKRIPLQAY